MDSGEEASFQITYQPSGKRKRRIESPYFEACGASFFSPPLCHGADFILFRPMGNATWVFPSAAIAYGVRGRGRRPVSKDHPL